MNNTVKELQDHFRQLRLSETAEELPQLLHPRRLLLAEKLVAALPGTALRRGDPGGHSDAPLLHVGDQRRKAFLERPPPPRHVPDEMSDAERRKILASIPRSQTLDGASALVLPDLAPDHLHVRVVHAHRSPLGFGRLEGGGVRGHAGAGSEAEQTRHRGGREKTWHSLIFVNNYEKSIRRRKLF